MPPSQCAPTAPSPGALSSGVTLPAVTLTDEGAWGELHAVLTRAQDVKVAAFKETDVGRGQGLSRREHSSTRAQVAAQRERETLPPVLPPEVLVGQSCPDFWRAALGVEDPNAPPSSTPACLADRLDGLWFIHLRRESMEVSRET
jgi:hypothetical protein